MDPKIMNTNKEEDCVGCGDGQSEQAPFPFMSQGKPTNKQEENWALMTFLQIPWHHALEITDKKDREFLLGKVTEVEAYLKQQQELQQQQQQQQQMMQQQHMNMQQNAAGGAPQGQVQPQMQPQMQPAAPVSVSPPASANAPQVSGPFVSQPQ